jgi:hypothetical protein
MMMWIHCISRELRVFKIIIIYVNFYKIIDSEKIEKYYETDNDVYILHV